MTTISVAYQRVHIKHHLTLNVLCANVEEAVFKTQLSFTAVSHLRGPWRRQLSKSDPNFKAAPGECLPRSEASRKQTTAETAVESLQNVWIQ